MVRQSLRKQAEENQCYLERNDTLKLGESFRLHSCLWIFVLAPTFHDSGSEHGILILPNHTNLHHTTLPEKKNSIIKKEVTWEKMRSVCIS